MSKPNDSLDYLINNCYDSAQEYRGMGLDELAEFSEKTAGDLSLVKALKNKLLAAREERREDEKSFRKMMGR